VQDFECQILKIFLNLICCTASLRTPQGGVLAPPNRPGSVLTFLKEVFKSSYSFSKEQNYCNSYFNKENCNQNVSHVGLQTGITISPESTQWNRPAQQDTPNPECTWTDEKQRSKN
jgi:hypothetical protein